jgi:hypothetical protein
MNTIRSLRFTFFVGAFLSISSLCTQVYGQTSPANVTLEGHVYDGKGNIVEGARIDLLPLEVTVSGPRVFISSDEHGYYHAALPAFGKTRISASKKGAGYPDTTMKLFSSKDDKAPIVDLKADLPVYDVDIHLGPPDGTVEGMVVDGSTQKIIGSARILMRWVEDSSVMYSENIPSTGDFQYSLPNRKITMIITAPGYKPWHYIDDTNNQPFIDLKPGEHVSVVATLESIPQ